MAKSIASYPENMRQAVADRRLRTKTAGNGYWAAIDFTNKKSKKS